MTVSTLTDEERNDVTEEDVDLSKLKTHEAELTEIPRGRKKRRNPMADQYEQSYREDKILGVDVPAGRARSVVSYLRQYAHQTGRGVSVQIQKKRTDEEIAAGVKPTVIPHEHVADRTTPDEIVTVSFLGREKNETD